MTYPKIIIKSSEEIDVTSYLEVIQGIENFSFQSKNYLILPYIPKQRTIAGKTIYFPRINNKPYNKSIKLDEISHSLKFNTINIDKYNKYMTTNFRNFWSDLSHIIPKNTLILVKEIQVCVTHIGSGGRSYINKKSNILTIIIRNDMPLQQILSLIILGILELNGHKESFSWEEKTAIREWVKESSVLNKYFPIHFPMLDGLRQTKQQAKYKIDSNTYLKELGMTSEITLSNEDISINCIKLVLTDKELKLFGLLYSKKGTIVDYDYIFKEVWNNDIEKFSLYSISKLVERIRKKLIKQKFSNEIIQSYKGKGYYISSNIQS